MSRTIKKRKFTWAKHLKRYERRLENKFVRTQTKLELKNEKQN